MYIYTYMTTLWVIRRLRGWGGEKKSDALQKGEDLKVTSAIESMCSLSGSHELWSAIEIICNLMSHII